MNSRRSTTLLAAVTSAALFAALSAAPARAQKPELVIQAGHASAVCGVAFSPDGRLVATASISEGFSTVSQPNVVKLWDATTGAELRTLDPGGAVCDLTFSQDGRRVVALGKVYKVWDVRSGAEIADAEFDAGAPRRAVSPDGKRVALFRPYLEADWGDVRIIDGVTGRELSRLTPGERVLAVEFDRDGRALRTLHAHGKIKTWDAATGAPVEVAKPEFDHVVRALSPDGRVFAETDDEAAVDTDGKNIILRDVATGREVRRLASRTSDFQKVLFSPDGSVLATGGERFSIRLWDLRNGVLRTLEGHTDYPVSADFSADGQLFATGGRDLTVRLWDVASGRALRELKGHKAGFIQLIRFSPDGKTFYSADKEGLKLWDAATGRELVEVGGGYYEEARHGIFHPRGHLLATAHAQGVKLWDTATGKEVRTLRGGGGGNIYFTADGRRLVSNGFHLVEMWDVETGRLLTSFAGPTEKEHSFRVSFLRGAVSPDSKMFAIAEYDTRDFETGPFWRVHVHDTETGKRLYTAEVNLNNESEDKGPLDPYGVLAFSTDGKQIVNVGSKGRAAAWDAATGARLAPEKTLKGLRADEYDRERFRSLWSVAPSALFYWDYPQYSPDGTYFVRFGLNGELRLVRTDEGREVASLIGIDERDWVVATPEGFFDGSPESWQQILWRFDNDTFSYAPVESFFNDFYHPGLLRDVISGRPPAPPEGRELARVDRRQPKVALRKIDAREAARPAGARRAAKAAAGEDAHAPREDVHAARPVSVVVEVEDNAEQPKQPGHAATGGARDVRLFRNGSLVRVWRGDVLGTRRSVALEATVPVVAGANRFTAYAFNRDNVKSADAVISVTGAESLRRPGTAYVITVGVNAYSNPAFNLRFAVADAEAFAAEFRNQQSRLGLFARVESVALRDAGATKKNVLKALAAVAAKARPEDVVAFYFAGHGKAHAGQFYLIPHDLGPAGRGAKTVDAAREAVLARGLSDRELEAVFERLDAGQLLMVIDACESGQALGAEGERRGPMNSKGLAQLAYEKGMYILTAAQSHQAALEVSQLGHGLLTYTLVEEGLRRAAADRRPRDGQVLLREWLDYATERVPTMQLDKIKTASAAGRDLNFDGAARGLPLPRRAGQRPRVFYRREPERTPLLVAKPEKPQTVTGDK